EVDRLRLLVVVQRLLAQLAPDPRLLVAAEGESDLKHWDTNFPEKILNAEVDADPAAIPDDEAESYEVEYVKEGTTIEVKENTTLLEAGEQEDWDLPYACRQGQCISCAGHITDGGNAEQYVEHHTNEMLGEPELDDGYTLTCVAYPTTDFSIEMRESP
ncbi:hypothetical protein BRD20_11125, partial [Halobacteriales archaeon SW_8_65_20]